MLSDRVGLWVCFSTGRKFRHMSEKCVRKKMAPGSGWPRDAVQGNEGADAAAERAD